MRKFVHFKGSFVAAAKALQMPAGMSLDFMIGRRHRLSPFAQINNQAVMARDQDRGTYFTQPGRLSIAEMKRMQLDEGRAWDYTQGSVTGRGFNQSILSTIFALQMQDKQLTTGEQANFHTGVESFYIGDDGVPYGFSIDALSNDPSNFIFTLIKHPYAALDKREVTIFASDNYFKPANEFPSLTIQAGAIINTVDDGDEASQWQKMLEQLGSKSLASSLEDMITTDHSASQLGLMVNFPELSKYYQRYVDSKGGGYIDSWMAREFDNLLLQVEKVVPDNEGLVAAVKFCRSLNYKPIDEQYTTHKKLLSEAFELIDRQHEVTNLHYYYSHLLPLLLLATSGYLSDKFPIDTADIMALKDKFVKQDPEFESALQSMMASLEGFDDQLFAKITIPGESLANATPLDCLSYITAVKRGKDVRDGMSLLKTISKGNIDLTDFEPTFPCEEQTLFEYEQTIARLSVALRVADEKIADLRLLAKVPGFKDKIEELIDGTKKALIAYANGESDELLSTELDADINFALNLLPAVNALPKLKLAISDAQSKLSDNANLQGLVSAKEFFVFFNDFRDRLSGYRERYTYTKEEYFYGQLEKKVASICKRREINSGELIKLGRQYQQAIRLLKEVNVVVDKINALGQFEFVRPFINELVKEVDDLLTSIDEREIESWLERLGSLVGPAETQARTEQLETHQQQFNEYQQFSIPQLSLSDSQLQQDPEPLISEELSSRRSEEAVLESGVSQQQTIVSSEHQKRFLQVSPYLNAIQAMIKWVPVNQTELFEKYQRHYETLLSHVAGSDSAEQQLPIIQAEISRTYRGLEAYNVLSLQLAPFPLLSERILAINIDEELLDRLTNQLTAIHTLAHLLDEIKPLALALGGAIQKELLFVEDYLMSLHTGEGLAEAETALYSHAEKIFYRIKLSTLLGPLNEQWQPAIQNFPRIAEHYDALLEKAHLLLANGGDEEAFETVYKSFSHLTETLKLLNKFTEGMADPVLKAALIDLSKKWLLDFFQNKEKASTEFDYASGVQLLQKVKSELLPHQQRLATLDLIDATDTHLVSEKYRDALKAKMATFVSQFTLSDEEDKKPDLSLRFHLSVKGDVLWDMVADDIILLDQHKKVILTSSDPFMLHLRDVITSAQKTIATGGDKVRLGHSYFRLGFDDGSFGQVRALLQVISKLRRRSSQLTSDNAAVYVPLAEKVGRNVLELYQKYLVDSVQVEPNQLSDIKSRFQLSLISLAGECDVLSSHPIFQLESLKQELLATGDRFQLQLYARINNYQIAIGSGELRVNLEPNARRQAAAHDTLGMVLTLLPSISHLTEDQLLQFLSRKSKEAYASMVQDLGGEVVNLYAQYLSDIYSSPESELEKLQEAFNTRFVELGTQCEALSSRAIIFAKQATNGIVSNETFKQLNDEKLSDTLTARLETIKQLDHKLAVDPSVVEHESIQALKERFTQVQNDYVTTQRKLIYQELVESLRLKFEEVIAEQKRLSQLTSPDGEPIRRLEWLKQTVLAFTSEKLQKLSEQQVYEYLAAINDQLTSVRDIHASIRPQAEFYAKPFLRQHLPMVAVVVVLSALFITGIILLASGVLAPVGATIIGLTAANFTAMATAISGFCAMLCGAVLSLQTKNQHKPKVSYDGLSDKVVKLSDRITRAEPREQPQVTGPLPEHTQGSNVEDSPSTRQHRFFRSASDSRLQAQPKPDLRERSNSRASLT